MSPLVDVSMHDEAVLHARRAKKSADLTWMHLEAEYSQDIDKVLATLATNAPLVWTLPMLADDGSVAYLARTSFEEIDDQYHAMRHFVEIHGWEALVEIRQGWYTFTHGVVTLKLLERGEFTRSETVTMFPIGDDGILGEVQIGAFGAHDEMGAVATAGALSPRDAMEKRVLVMSAHDRYVDALRSEDVGVVVAAHRANGAAAIRSYLTEESTVVNTVGAPQLGEYFSKLFERYRVSDVQLVNRVAESWYVFAELHWSVEERAGARRTLEFCTAETSPLDSEGRYWVRTGAGTDPVET